jgi:hypothetical protein
MLHPRVGRDDEESREPGAQKDEKRGEPVHDLAEQFFAEQQQAQKCRFEKEGAISRG